jgi:hypothetical protein
MAGLSVRCGGSVQIGLSRGLVSGAREPVGDGIELRSCAGMVPVVQELLSVLGTFGQAGPVERSLKERLGPATHGEASRAEDGLSGGDSDVVRTDVADVGALLNHAAEWARR